LNDYSPVRKRFLIIHNPLAGMRRRWMLHEVCRYLRLSGAEMTVAHADDLDADRRLASQAAQDGTFDAVIAAGGDTTVRGVAAGLVGSTVPLGIIPVGTGNVLVHEIGMRKGPKGIAKCLRHGPSIPVTAGSVNGEPFCLMVGVGFDARVLARLDTVWKRRMGKLAYIWPVMSELAQKQSDFEVQIDGRPYRCRWLIVTKAKHYSGPFHIARAQHLQSDRFHAVLITARTGRDLAGVLLAIGLGCADRHPDVKLIPCRRVVVPGGQDVVTQIDGDAFDDPPLEIGMDSKPLQIIVPPDLKPPRRVPASDLVAEKDAA